MSPKVHSVSKFLLAVTRLLEFNVAIFAFLVNLPWEFFQIPLFEGMASAPHWEASKSCAQAALGDAVIMVVAYWLVAAITRTRHWIVAPTVLRAALFALAGVTITVIIEWLALHGLWMESWRYSPAMPVLPGIGVGLSPLLQWIVLPPLAAWFVHRQLMGFRS